MYDHDPIVIDSFNGLWMRGDPEKTPPDHFSNVNNIEFIYGGFKTRSGVNAYFPQKNVVRQYTYTQITGDTLLILDVNGNIYHSAFPNIVILSIAGMTDFGFVSINGRAYISPCNGITGLSGQSVYVYKGDGSQARLAGGAAPTGSGFTATVNASGGNTGPGFYLFGVVAQTDTGFLTQIGPAVFASAKLTAVNANGNGISTVSLTNIPLGPSGITVNRQIVATIAIDNYTGDQTQYEMFFIPGAVINDNTTTSLTVNFYDADLIDSAANLLSLFTNIPAGVGLGQYHGRLISYGEAANPGLVRVSNAGEPEAVDQVDGLLLPPLSNLPLSNGQEYRDVLYIFRNTKTYAFSDNGDVPSSWSITILDEAIGAPLHGVATILDSGGVSVDFLTVLTFGGIYLFNGTYFRPELSWKIKDFWSALLQSNFPAFQILSDPLNQILYISILNNQILVGDYKNGLDPVNIRWTIWTFLFQTNTICLFNSSSLLIGASGV